MYFANNSFKVLPGWGRKIPREQISQKTTVVIGHVMYINTARYLAFFIVIMYFFVDNQSLSVMKSLVWKKYEFELMSKLEGRLTLLGQYGICFLRSSSPRARLFLLLGWFVWRRGN
jgi:hypothetical protein